MAFTVIVDDMRAALDAMEPDSVDSIVTDPPYEYGFMGKSWDSTGVAFDPATWAACLRVLKPGGHLLAFGSTRTSHRIACGIEDAGFEIRDTIVWMFGSGFPKSHDVSKAIDRAAGLLKPEGKGFSYVGGGQPPPPTKGYVRPAHATPDTARWSGWGTALKPAMEPVIVARKPFGGTVAANVLLHGTGAINVDGCRIGTEERVNEPGSTNLRVAMGGGWREDAAPTTAVGRWPANVILDVEAGAALDEQSGTLTSGSRAAGVRKGIGYESSATGDGGPAIVGDSGGASRFFYSPKASGDERDAGLDDLPTSTRGEIVNRDEDSAGIKSAAAGAGRKSEGRRNIHATVKPIDLMRYLCRLVTPPGGTVLDPFAGSGTTLVAGVLEGFDVIGVEMQTDHACIAWHRVRHWAGLTLAPGIEARSVAEKPRTGPAALDLFL